MIDMYQHLKLNNLQLNQIYKEFFRIKVLMMLTEKLNISWHIFNGCEYRYICLFYHCYGNIINTLVVFFSGGKDTKFNVIQDHIMISTLLIITIVIYHVNFISRNLLVITINLTNKFTLHKLLQLIWGLQQFFFITITTGDRVI